VVFIALLQRYTNFTIKYLNINYSGNIIYKQAIYEIILKSTQGARDTEA